MTVYQTYVIQNNYKYIMYIYIYVKIKKMSWYGKVAIGSCPLGTAPPVNFQGENGAQQS